MDPRFDPAGPQQPVYVAYGPAAIPDPRDATLDEYVDGLRRGGPAEVAGALAEVSEAGRRVLGAYAERAASRAVREGSVDLLVSALVANVVGGLDQNALEALMPMALIEDAGRRIGAEPGVFFGTAADIVGHPGGVNIMIWLARDPDDRTPEAMGFAPSGGGSRFRYAWAG